MKQSETQKYGHFLNKLTTEELEKLLSTVLKEMRRRDSDQMKSDVLDITKALWKVQSPDKKKEGGADDLRPMSA